MQIGSYVGVLVFSSLSSNRRTNTAAVLVTCTSHVPYHDACSSL